MHGQLVQVLQNFRRQRAFQASAYLEARLRLSNDYFRATGVRGCVVGVSGGVDSAVVLALMERARQQPGSPLRRVVPALIPMFVEAGATNQDVALQRGRLVAAAVGLQEAVVDLSQPLAVTKASVDRGYGREGQPWAAGQLVSYLRTPALYYLTALLTEDDCLSVLCGTTNRDEGSYIGFFGKASDGMVDYQPISDLHKSEVRQLARLLGIPSSVVEATPTGDTYDGRPDEQMIGAPYDFLELYEHWLCADRPALELGPQARQQWNDWAVCLEELHRKNLHKYVVGSVAVHLDILPRAVPGGWRSEVYTPWSAGPSTAGRLVGEFSLQTQPSAWEAPGPARSLADLGEACLTLEDLLSPLECQQLMAEVMAQTQVAVGIHGRVSDAQRSGGSNRATACSPAWAEELWRRLAPHLPPVRLFDELSSTDHGGHPVWRAVGVNPVLRFLCYHPGGQLVPHYDAGFDFQDGRRHTLMSLVVYLNSLPEGQGGQTRFLLDPQRGAPLEERDHQDWESTPLRPRVVAAVHPQAGRALLFDHRLLHDGELWRGNEPRVLLRTDIIFERCGLLPARLVAPARPEGEPPCKVRADRFYGPLWARLGQAGIEEAGYFEDSRSDLEPDVRAEPEWLCTPLFHVQRRLQEAGPDQPLAVLLTTGAFCPVHPGHLAMMESARETLEALGVAVLGGYLSPSHDEYVLSKCGPEVPGAAHRVHLSRQAVADSCWLMVDEWEALHTSAALNFTEVIERLSAYLNRHLLGGRPIRVYYVFGSDNARFCLTFVERGQAVCVERAGFEDRLQAYAQHPLVVDNPRVTFVRGKDVPGLTSTQVRNGEVEVLATPVREIWQDWQVTDPVSRPIRFFLRDEGLWSVEPWVARVGGEELLGRSRLFGERVKEAIEEGFAGAYRPDPPRPLQLSILSLLEQRSRARRELLSPSENQGCRLLSLDPCWPGDENLGVSRCFELGGGRVCADLVVRPGWPTLDQQLSRLPAGDYALVDDDIATGHTMRWVESVLPARCRVVARQALCELPVFSGEAGLVDLGDQRDFLLGAREGGLVVRLPDQSLARVPYLLPYVNPAERLSLPISRAYEFSRRLWQLNQEFFEGLNLTLEDAPEAFRGLTHYLGIPSEWSLARWSAWHLLRLPGP